MISKTLMISTILPPGLKECMVSGYTYIDGMEEVLQYLKHNNYEMHAFTNYPIWSVEAHFG